MMYLSLGSGRFENKTEIIGIFDLDITSQSKITRGFLNERERSGNVKNAAEDIPRTFVVMKNGEVILSGPSSSTLIKRIEEQ